MRDIRAKTRLPLLFSAALIGLLQGQTDTRSTATAAQAADQKTSINWPSHFQSKRPARLRLSQKGGIGKNYIYQTRHFELHSPVAINEHNAKLFASTAESVPAVLARLPLPLLGMPTQQKARVFIYPDEESFVKAGGCPDAAGYYSGRQVAVLLRADTFLKPVNPASRLQPKANFDLLVHEFTHLCMHRDLRHLPSWFAEGTAEYLAATHQSHGQYQFTNVERCIRQRIQRHLPNDQGVIVLPGITDTLNLNGETWRTRILDLDIDDHYRSYATSLLLVHTLFHAGKQRRHDTLQFLKSHQTRSATANAVNILLPVEQHRQTEQRIIKYWRPHGLHLRFQAAEGHKKGSPSQPPREL